VAIGRDLKVFGASLGSLQAEAQNRHPEGVLCPAQDLISNSAAPLPIFGRDRVVSLRRRCLATVVLGACIGCAVLGMVPLVQPPIETSRFNVRP
jgi:hypothetical protein